MLVLFGFSAIPGALAHGGQKNALVILTHQEVDTCGLMARELKSPEIEYAIEVELKPPSQPYSDGKQQATDYFNIPLSSPPVLSSTTRTIYAKSRVSGSEEDGLRRLPDARGV